VGSVIELQRALGLGGHDRLAVQPEPAGVCSQQLDVKGLESIDVQVACEPRRGVPPAVVGRRRRKLHKLAGCDGGSPRRRGPRRPWNGGARGRPRAWRRPTLGLQQLVHAVPAAILFVKERERIGDRPEHEPVRQRVDERRVRRRLRLSLVRGCSGSTGERERPDDQDEPWEGRAHGAGR
jgi:hypothetical protein